MPLGACLCWRASDDVFMWLFLRQLPAQMGSLLGSSLALQYLDCVQDESALLRLNFWLGYALHEGKWDLIGREATKPLWHHHHHRQAGEVTPKLKLTLSWTPADYLVWLIKGNYFRRRNTKFQNNLFYLSVWVTKFYSFLFRVFVLQRWRSQ